jgi:hypothetical protein
MARRRKDDAAADNRTAAGARRGAAGRRRRLAAARATRHARTRVAVARVRVAVARQACSPSPPVSPRGASCASPAQRVAALRGARAQLTPHLPAPRSLSRARAAARRALALGVSRNAPVWDDAGGGAWTPLPPLAGDAECDVVVVGLGASGLTAILELATRGLRVVGLDARDVAGGAAGRNGGLLLAGAADFYHDHAARVPCGHGVQRVAEVDHVDVASARVLHRRMRAAGAVEDGAVLGAISKAQPGGPCCGPG